MISTKGIFSVAIALNWLLLGEAAPHASFIAVQHASSLLRAQNMKNDDHLESRRSLLHDFALGSSGLISGLMIQKESAFASGGATAGGVYLLSAKQRYNDRVTKGIKSFLALGPSLKGGSMEEAKAYFTSEDVGSWKDTSVAGYLLANAFRRSSNTAPDSLPAVKKWKAFAGEVAAVEKQALKKKGDASKTLDAYNQAKAALDGYLDEVELPPSIEMSKN